jgi:hypothetical protein
LKKGLVWLSKAGVQFRDTSGKDGVDADVNGFAELQIQPLSLTRDLRLLVWRRATQGGDEVYPRWKTN